MRARRGRTKVLRRGIEVRGHKTAFHGANRGGGSLLLEPPPSVLILSAHPLSPGLAIHSAIYKDLCDLLRKAANCLTILPRINPRTFAHRISKIAARQGSRGGAGERENVLSSKKAQGQPASLFSRQSERPGSCQSESDTPLRASFGLLGLGG